MASDFTVDRNSSKWVLGDNGYLKEYTTDQPAIEFNADGSYKGVLVEPESINEQKASEDLDDTTYWSVEYTSIAGDAETDPKGGTNSFLLSETTNNDLFIVLILLFRNVSWPSLEPQPTDLHQHFEGLCHGLGPHVVKLLKIQKCGLTSVNAPNLTTPT